MEENIVFTKIMVEIKSGIMINITDLPKEQYEYFLELMHNLRIAYNIISNDTKKTIS